MLIVVSPAKRLDETESARAETSAPVFQDHADELATIARELTSADLEKLMHISPKLGALNVERFAAFGSGAGEKPAIDMFSGDTYAGLDASSLSDDEMRYAQDHLNILSGLYGLLRPLDNVAPYRLEMGTRLKNNRGKNLYEFWGDLIAKELNKRAKSVENDLLINCASVEYFSAIDLKALNLKIITPQFMEMKSGKPKIVSFFAKKARGAMARYIIQNRLRDPESLKDFELGGYKYNSDLSGTEKWVFLRDEG
jgi:cytoplasmic iron level regulating protein YaaA (DUF328/UPF0246 family)